MRSHVLSVGEGVMLLLATPLAACGGSGSQGSRGGPVSNQPSGPPPGALRAEQERKQLPGLARADDVPAFINAAGAAPVSHREDVRAAIQRAGGNGEIANRLISEFRAAQKTDFSRALLILSLIGEQRHPAGTAFLNSFIWQPLPTGGRPTAELGLSPEAEALERLQVKAANALPYARSPEALQATLQVVAKHPLKPVRIEAASSYLWNTGNTAEARRTLSQYLRSDERMVLDRPVREDGMSAQRFNTELALYLERHPEVRPPAPQRNKRGQATRNKEEPAGPPPPSDRATSNEGRQP